MPPRSGRTSVTGRLSRSWLSKGAAGTRVNPLFLSLDEVLEMHQQQIDLYGGSPGVRDSGALESALATPRATFGLEYLHRSIPAMAAAYLFHLCQGHPFVDGNKRVGANAAITFLLMNNWEPNFEPDEFFDLVLSVASGMVDKAALTALFELHCRPSDTALTE